MRYSVFLDTSGLIALSSAKDAHADRARAWFAARTRGGRPAATTHWVLAEYFAMFANRRTRVAALALVKDLQASELFVLLPLDARDFDAGLTLYARRADKDWSLVDCITMHWCRALEVTDVLTADKHFVQAGLSALLTRAAP